MNIDRFLEIEKKYNLYSIDVNGINFWIYFRQKLWNFQICAQKLEMTSATKIDRSISVFIRRCRYYLNTKIYKNIDILFLNHSRRIKSGRYYDCMYTEEISSRYSSTGTLEDAFQQVHFAPNRTANLMFTDNIWINSVAYTKLFKIFSKRKYNEFYKKIKEQIEPAIKEIESFYSWEADIDKIVLECLNIVLRVTYARGKYFKVLKKINPKMIVEVVNYSFSRMIVNEYAHMYGIPVVELQHGIIYSEHAAYNFASGFDIKQYPDKIFLYSDFWKDQMRPPIPEKNLISVGFPFFEKSIKKYSNIKRDDNRITILFISQWTIGEQLSELAVELSNALPKDGYANSHFLRPAGPHFPASQGHFKRSALEIGRARGAPPC